MELEEEYYSPLIGICEVLHFKESLESNTQASTLLFNILALKARHNVAFAELLSVVDQQDLLNLQTAFEKAASTRTDSHQI